jgi:hypothetical protein
MQEAVEQQEKLKSELKAKQVTRPPPPGGKVMSPTRTARLPRCATNPFSFFFVMTLKLGDDGSKPCIRNPKPCTRNHKPCTRNHGHEIMYPKR